MHRGYIYSIELIRLRTTNEVEFQKSGHLPQSSRPSRTFYVCGEANLSPVSFFSSPKNLNTIAFTDLVSKVTTGLHFAGISIPFSAN